MEKLKTISETKDLTNESLRKTEIVKALSNGMMFKLYCDVRNGANNWNIYVWSNALCQWNLFASYGDIPNLQRFDYVQCRKYGSMRDENLQAKLNFIAMKDFIKAFVDNLQS